MQEGTSSVLSLLRMPRRCCLSIPGCEVSHSGPVGLVSKRHRYLPFWYFSLQLHYVDSLSA